MRKRINRVCIASSSNYARSKKIHRQMLEENHSNNIMLFMTINPSHTSSSPKTKEEEYSLSLTIFENNIKRQIREFKQSKTILK